MNAQLFLLLMFATLAFAATDYGPQIVVQTTADPYNVPRIIYKTIPIPTNCSAYLNIAAQMTVPWWELANTPNYTQNNQFRLQGSNAILSYWYWMEARNNQSGILIGDTRYCINLTVINSGFTTTSVVMEAQKILRGDYGNFDLHYAPWSSGLTKVVAPLYNSAEKILLAGYAAATEIYKCGNPINTTQQPYCANLSVNERTFQYVTSALPEAAAFYSPLFSVLKIVGAKSIAGFASDEAFTLALFSGAIQNAKNFGMEVLYNGTVSPTPSDAEIAAQVQALKEAGADVVLAAPRFVAGCVQFVKEIKAQNYYPKALLLSQCVDDPVARDAVGSDLSFALDYITWHESLSGSAYEDALKRLFPATSDKSSSEIFYDKFYERWGVYPDRFSAPVGIIMGYIVESAYQFIGNVSKDDFLYALNFVRETTFWGTFGFDAFGFDVFKEFISVQVKPDLTYNLVAPLEGSSAFIIYPAPTWDERIFKPIYLAQPIERVGVAFGVFGLFSSLCCAIWLIIHVDSPSVKAAQPPFLGLMLVGACILYSVLIVWTLYVNDAMCIARNWLLSAGFVILYGTLVGRVHRVSSVIAVAKSFDRNGKVINNSALFKIIGIILGIDVIILIVWSAVSPSQMKMETPDPLRASKNFTTCGLGTLDIIFIVILGVYKLLIVGYGIYLSVLLWQNRSSVFIESRKVIFCFYNLALFAAIWIVLQNTLTDQNLLYIFRSACIFISVFATTVILFVPRMLNPNKTTSIITETSGNSTGSKPSSAASNQQVENLKKQIADLEEQIRRIKSTSGNNTSIKKMENSSETEPEDAEEKARKKKALERKYGGNDGGTATTQVEIPPEDSSETEE